MAGKRRTAETQRSRSTNARRDDYPELMSAEEIAARYERAFPALSPKMQDAIVRLVETNLQARRPRRRIG